MENSLSIGVVTQQFGKVLSGPGLHARNLVNHLVADGHRVTLITPANQAPNDTDGFQYVPVANAVLSSHARWFLLSQEFARAATAMEKKQKIDLWHFTDAREALFHRTQRPIVGNINDTYSAEVRSPAYYRSHYQDWLTRWAYYALLHQVDRWSWAHCAILLANSQYTSNAISQYYPRLQNKLTLCYKSVETGDFSRAWSERKQGPNHPARILCVGGNMQRKGVPDLIRAVPTIAVLFPQVEVWIVGKDPATPTLQAMASELGMADRVKFLGWKSREDLIDLYAQCDIFAMPSLTESLGVAFLEAMAAGVPTVGTAVGGIPEIIQNGNNGLLVPPENPPALAQALIKILQNPFLQEQFRGNGLSTARKFSVESMMECTYQSYRSALEKANK